MKNSTLVPTSKALTATQIIANLAKLEGWKLSGDGSDLVIEKTYQFASYAQTMTFVNSVAWIAQIRNHHPALQVHFDRCVVQYQTHDVGGLTQLDFDNAATIDALPMASPGSIS